MTRALLAQLHTYARPYRSRTVKTFCREYLRPLPGARADQYGNWHVRIGEDPIMLWSSHTDTVHHAAGRVRVQLDARGILTTDDPIASCLGADDTAGVAIMIAMIGRAVPGHYIFHAGEEVGGIGSRGLARAWPKDLHTVKYAIALDRAGTRDIITRQAGRRTASDAFAQSLASAIGMAYTPSSHGVFTDTANYTDVVGECTNVSVGYTGAHGRSESLDTDHVLELLERLCTINVSDLVCDRAAGDVDDLPEPIDFRTYRDRYRATTYGRDRSTYLSPEYAEILDHLDSGQLDDDRPDDRDAWDLDDRPWYAGRHYLDTANGVRAYFERRARLRALEEDLREDSRRRR